MTEDYTRTFAIIRDIHTWFHTDKWMREHSVELRTTITETVVSFTIVVKRPDGVGKSRQIAQHLDTIQRAKYDPFDTIGQDIEKAAREMAA